MQLNPVSMQFEKLDLLGFLSGIFWAVGIVILGRYPNVDFKIATLSQYLCGTVITRCCHCRPWRCTARYIDQQQGGADGAVLQRSDPDAVFPRDHQGYAIYVTRAGWHSDAV